MRKILRVLLFVIFSSANYANAQSGVCGFVSRAYDFLKISERGNFTGGMISPINPKLLSFAFQTIAKLPNVDNLVREKARMLEAKYQRLTTSAIEMLNCLARENQMMPEAFSIGITAFGDVGIGGMVSSEFLFFVHPDQSLEIIQYRVHGARVGASLQIGGEVSLNLVYDLDNPDNYKGIFVGVGISAELKIGVGAALYAGVPNLSSLRFANESDFIEYLLFQAPVPFIVAVSGNVGAGAGGLVSYSEYAEVVRYQKMSLTGLF